MMDIALVRVDSRLVHGQIIEAWVPYLKIRCICVANDEVANDFFRETVMKLAVPQGVEVFFTVSTNWRRRCHFIRVVARKHSSSLNALVMPSVPTNKGLLFPS